MAAPTTYNFADVWEMAADMVPDQEALVVIGQGRRTYAELEERANRFANHLLSIGVEPGEHVAVYLENCCEYLEVFLGSFKARAVPINVNFRYVSDELRHLLDDSDSVVVVHESHFADRLDAVRDRLPTVRHTIELGDEYETALAAASPDRPSLERSNDDHYVIYTGGTTGLPKGVVWRMEDAFFACIGGGDPMRMSGPVDEPAELVDRVGQGLCGFPIAPLMHAAGSWVSLMYFFSGGKIVLLRGPLDPAACWRAVGEEGINMMTFIGDAVGRPMMDEWDANGERYDTSTLFAISNGGAPMSAALKQRIADRFPNIVMTDGFGSSEVGARGTSRLTADEVKQGGGVAQFTPVAADTLVIDDDDNEVEPGSGVIGRVVSTGHLPLGYYNDPDKTARTFVEMKGKRWAITGDMATVGDDGTVELAGRGSGCINTGGEKVFPEEVEAVLKAHPAVYDVLVVGVPDERWGSAVAAIVQPPSGVDAPSLDDLNTVAREHLASYKLPKHLVTVDQVERSPAGKPDYRWAREVATGSVAAT